MWLLDGLQVLIHVQFLRTLPALWYAGGRRAFCLIVCVCVRARFRGGSLTALRVVFYCFGLMCSFCGWIAARAAYDVHNKDRWRVMPVLL